MVPLSFKYANRKQNASEILSSSSRQDRMCTYTRVKASLEWKLLFQNKKIVRLQLYSPA